MTRGKITAFIPIPGFEEGKYLVMMTKMGTVKKTPLMNMITRRGGYAIDLDGGDELIRVVTDGHCNIIIGTHNGMAIRFSEKDVRPMGRIARGVRGIKLRTGDYVVGASICREGGDLLVVSETGLEKGQNGRV